jgi:hypothetical protein
LACIDNSAWNHHTSTTLKPHLLVVNVSSITQQHTFVSGEKNTRVALLRCWNHAELVSSFNVYPIMCWLGVKDTVLLLRWCIERDWKTSFPYKQTTICIKTYFKQTHLHQTNSYSGSNKLPRFKQTTFRNIHRCTIKHWGRSSSLNRSKQKVLRTPRGASIRASHSTKRQAAMFACCRA